MYVLISSFQKAPSLSPLPLPSRRLILRSLIFPSPTQSPNFGSNRPGTCSKQASGLHPSALPFSTYLLASLALCECRPTLTPASRGSISMIPYRGLLQRSSSVSLFPSPVSIAAYPEHAPTLAPSCALGANDGATIILSAAVKAYAVRSVEDLISSPHTLLLSTPRKWIVGTVLIAAPQRRRSAITQP
jgi:hypothetical protein